MKEQKKLLRKWVEIAKKVVPEHTSSRLIGLFSTLHLKYRIFQKKLFIWNTFHSAYNTPYVASYAMFSTTGNTKYLKRIKWLYVPKFVLLQGYFTISEELSKIISSQAAKKKASLVKDIQYNETKLTRLYLCYYILHVREDETVIEVLNKYGIKTDSRDNYIKMALSSIKMLETKQKILIDKYELQKEESKIELDDFLQNKMEFSKAGYIGYGDCTVAEYGLASKRYKKEIDRIINKTHGKD